jgi:hypothetical protein
VLIAIALIVFIGQAEALHERFSFAERSDEWLHEFFGKFLKDFEGCLHGIAKSEIRANESREIMESLETVKREIEFYRSRGIETNASLAIGPFLSFSKNLSILAEAQQDFLDEIRNLKEGKGDYRLVATAILKAKSSIEGMGKALDEIDSVVFYDNATPLFFKTSGIRELLDEIESLFELYEGVAKAYEVDGIWVFVSKHDPFLFERIRIWIYARNVTPTDLFIDKTRFEPREMEYSFETLGKHLIYARGIRGDESVKSNVVEINVIKIPTYIFLSSSTAFIGEETEINGLIRDHYGAKMSVPLKLFIDGKELLLESKDGMFSLKIKRDYECRVRIEAFYEGNETHEGSYAEEIVHFTRFPVWIMLESDRQRVSVGEEVLFNGTISESLPIEIVVNSEEMLKLKAGKNFSFSLNFSAPGVYEIYARFPGDELRRPAESNRIKIVVYEPFLQKNHLILVILLSLLLLSAFAIERVGKRKAKQEERAEIKVSIAEDKKEEKKESGERSLEAMFIELFEALVKKFRLKKSLTPRELLKELRNWNFADKLREIVELHEKFAYAGVKLSKEEEERFFKLSSEILSQL